MIKHYKLYFEFIRTYSRVGFKGIDRNDPLILSLEEKMNFDKQFLLVFDMINMKTEFVSNGSKQMLGIEPDNLTSYHFKEATHPEDLRRNALGLAQMFKEAHDLFVAKKGEIVMSSNFRMRNISGDYTDKLIQAYFFYCQPLDTVYLINIITDISWYKKMKHGFHYYLGNDLSYFRYPDEQLLMTGNVLTEREFEIIRLIQEGYDSEHIAEKLFLSKHTVNTHRKNILEKTGKPHISDLIYYFQECGLL